MKLHLLTLSAGDGLPNEDLQTFIGQNRLHHTNIPVNEDQIHDLHRVGALADFLGQSTFEGDDLILVVDGNNTQLIGEPSHYVTAFSSFEVDILFAADAHFDYPDGPLQYYYWKFYPRYDRYFNYLNAGALMGRAPALEQMCLEIKTHLMGTDIANDEPLLTRWYVDRFLEVIERQGKVKLDHRQTLLSANGGAVNVSRWPRINWVQDHSFQLLENEKVGRAGLSKYQNKLRFLTKEGNTFRNRLTRTTPCVIHFPADLFSNVERSSFSSRAWWLSFLAFGQSIGRALLVFIINRFSINPQQTFRFGKHKNPDYENVMQHFLSLLENKEAFTFAHFNDGELNFIRKYLNNDHKKTWNGRIQDQYDVPLAERLLDSIEYKQKNYFLGVSCSTCAAPRRKIADELIGDYPHKIGAMVFHHNLYYLPQLINHMRNREMYYVVNDYQELDVLENLGVTLNPENVIRIPFVNSHKEYDNLEGRKFPDGAMVILMCGMLAKILIRNWYELNPNTTFIAFGSTMDDFIQTSNTKYRPYPRKLPLTRNVHLIKAFLFGNKKNCEECYNL